MKVIHLEENESEEASCIREVADADTEEMRRGMFLREYTARTVITKA